MKALGRAHMARHDDEGSVADLIGQRRQRQVDPLGLEAHALSVEWSVIPNLSNRIVASSCGPMKPHGVAWNGAGIWLIASQSRQVNFSRTVSISLKRRGISSSVSVTSSPSFDSPDPAACRCRLNFHQKCRSKIPQFRRSGCREVRRKIFRLQRHEACGSDFACNFNM